MFFTPELLQRRDSGFGLLWLAATIGSKSSLKKLPRKGILTADIPGLCTLITAPEEPLALRLSANLMVGVIRVYNARHEIWATDVTQCFTTLKKAVSAMYEESGALEMAQTSVRPDTITLDANMGFSMDLDISMTMLDPTWDDFVIRGLDHTVVDSSFEGAPRPRQKHNRSITLDESHLLSQDMQLDDFYLQGFASSSARLRSSSAGGGVREAFASSSGNEAFFNDIYIGLDDQGAAGGDPDEELNLGLDEWAAGGLGEEWGTGGWDGAPPHDDVGNGFRAEDGDAGFPAWPEDGLDIGAEVRRDMQAAYKLKGHGLPRSTPRRRPGSRTPSLTRSATPPSSPPSGQHSALKRPMSPSQAASRPKKRVKLLLDVRTELTDAELIANREGYVEAMERAWRESKSHKASDWVSGMINENVPQGYDALELKEYWQEILAIGAEARNKKARGSQFPEREPKQKRRRTNAPISDDGTAQGRDRVVYPGMDNVLPEDLGQFGGNVNDWGMGIGMGDQPMMFNGDEGAVGFGTPRLDGFRSRHGSPDIEIGRGLGSSQVIIIDGSQRSNMFPWNDAAGGPSSSSYAGFGFDNAGGGGRSSSFGGGSGGVGVELADSRIKPSSRSNSIHPSPAGSGIAARFGSAAEERFDDFEGFQIPPDDAGPAATQSQSQDADSLAKLERHSLDFLEQAILFYPLFKADPVLSHFCISFCRYAKWQMKALPTGRTQLGFADIVPTATSTPHVAAAAFYHCLVLATKSLVGLQQDAFYGELKIKILLA